METASGKSLRLKPVQSHNDPILEAAGLGGSRLTTTYHGEAILWLAVDAEGFPMTEGFQGYCVLPEDGLTKRRYDGEPADPVHVDFLSSNGLTLYEYRLVEPDPESGEEATLDL